MAEQMSPREQGTEMLDAKLPPGKLGEVTDGCVHHPDQGDDFIS